MTSETGPCDKCQGSGKLFDRRIGDVGCDECHGHGWFNEGVSGPAKAAPHEWLCAVHRGGKCTCSVLDRPHRCPRCTVCGTPAEKHGTYPSCASHPYTADAHCEAVGTVDHGQFTGLPCPGTECANGCVRAMLAAPLLPQTRRSANTTVERVRDKPAKTWGAGQWRW